MMLVMALSVKNATKAITDPIITPNGARKSADVTALLKEEKMNPLYTPAIRNIKSVNKEIGRNGIL